MFAHLSPKERWEKAFEIQAHARRAPFYAEKYAELKAPFDADSWRRLPLLEQGDLVAHRYPESTAMLTSRVESHIVVATGVARCTAFSWDEWDGFVRTEAEALTQMGVGADDLVANLFPAGDLWPSFLGAHDALRVLRAGHLPISANLPPDEILRTCLEFQPTVMIALPPLLILLADLARQQGVKFDRLHLLGYVGEPMSDAAQQHVREALGVDDLRSLGCSNADAGLVGYTCHASPAGTYHVPSASQFLEILDAESGAPAAFGESGQIVVTSLGRRTMPVVRYRLGEAGHFVAGRCECGDPNPRFHLERRREVDATAPAVAAEPVTSPEAPTDAAPISSSQVASGDPVPTPSSEGVSSDPAPAPLEATEPS